MKNGDFRKLAAVMRDRSSGPHASCHSFPRRCSPQNVGKRAH
jgi:hypothetical protein